MNEAKEGVIKFDYEWINKEVISDDISELNRWRQRLYCLNLIGADKEGIGFGNISTRVKDGFVISGSQTGGLNYLTKEHYAKVVSCNQDESSIVFGGAIKASSESLAHGAVYELDKSINAVIHIHNFEMWNKLMDRIPTNPDEVGCGTPELAYAIKDLFDNTDLKEKKIFVIRGHKAGLMSFGKDLDEAGDIILKYYKKIK